MTARERLDQIIATSRAHEEETRATLHKIMRSCNALESIRAIGTDAEIERVVAALAKDVPEIIPS